MAITSEEGERIVTVGVVANSHGIPITLIFVHNILAPLNGHESKMTRFMKVLRESPTPQNRTSSILTSSLVEEGSIKISNVENIKPQKPLIPPPFTRQQTFD